MGRTKGDTERIRKLLVLLNEKKAKTANLPQSGTPLVDEYLLDGGAEARVIRIVVIQLCDLPRRILPRYAYPNPS